MFDVNKILQEDVTEKHYWDCFQHLVTTCFAYCAVVLYTLTVLSKPTSLVPENSFCSTKDCMTLCTPKMLLYKGFLTARRSSKTTRSQFLWLVNFATLLIFLYVLDALHPLRIITWQVFFNFNNSVRHCWWYIQMWNGFSLLVVDWIFVILDHDISSIHRA